MEDEEKIFDFKANTYGILPEDGNVDHVVSIVEKSTEELLSLPDFDITILD